MKKSLLYIFCLLAHVSAFAQYTIKGGMGEPLLAVNGGTGGVSVYLLNTLSGAEISYTSSEDGTHYWYKYDRSALEATAIACVQDGRTSRITDVEDGWGYFVGSTTSSRTSYVWIIDYSLYKPRIVSLGFSEESTVCEEKLIKVTADVQAEPLIYYSSSGARTYLNRTYTLTYNTLKWNEDDFMFYDHVQEMKPMETNGAIGELIVPAPLIDTNFTLKGDSFSEHFGMGTSLSTGGTYEAIVIEAYAEMEQLNASDSNGTSTEEDGSLKSAPYRALFRAQANEPAAVMYRWKIEKQQDSGEFYTITQRTGEKQFEWEFTEDGYYRAELEVTNKYSTCAADTIITLSIASSELDVPNYFSPGNSSGYHTEFKVHYRSITNFKCSISNRWGNLLYTWTDPELGWDGKVNGMYVATGVYYYTIEYTDSQGKKKSKKGPINVLREIRQ